MRFGRYELSTRTDTWESHPLRQWVMETMLGRQVQERRETTSIELKDWQGQSWHIETDGRCHVQLLRDETLLVSYEDGRVELYGVPPHRPIAAFALMSAVASLLFTGALWWRFGR